MFICQFVKPDSFRKYFWQRKDFLIYSLKFVRGKNFLERDFFQSQVVGNNFSIRQCLFFFLESLVKREEKIKFEAKIKSMAHEYISPLYALRLNRQLSSSSSEKLYPRESYSTKICRALRDVILHGKLKS